MNAEFPKLPCWPCPHAASCCAYGTTLTDEEAAAIEANHGPGLVFKNGGCVIHAESYYPAVCAGFPWIDAETGGPYEFDVEICGEFVRNPELVAIQRGRTLQTS